MEQGLYAKFVKLRWKDLKSIAENKNKNEATFKFQGLSTRSQHWFDLGFDCIEVNFSTREPDFNNIFFKSMTIHKIQIYLDLSSSNSKFKMCGNIQASQWWPNPQLFSEVFK